MKKSVFFVLALWGGAALAAVSLAKPFSDGLVLQRERPVPVWGAAAPGEKVTMAFAGASVSATADGDGVPDGVERAEGTDPNASTNYCCNISASTMRLKHFSCLI